MSRKRSRFVEPEIIGHVYTVLKKQTEKSDHELPEILNLEDIFLLRIVVPYHYSRIEKKSELMKKFKMVSGLHSLM